MNLLLLVAAWCIHKITKSWMLAIVFVVVSLDQPFGFVLLAFGLSVVMGLIG
jgi:hypothetical protein